MKKQFMVLTALIGLVICLLVLQPGIANACDSKCNAATIKPITVAPQKAAISEEENIDSRIHPFPFGVI